MVTRPDQLFSTINLGGMNTPGSRPHGPHDPFDGGPGSQSPYPADPWTAGESPYPADPWAVDDSPYPSEPWPVDDPTYPGESWHPGAAPQAGGPAYPAGGPDAAPEKKSGAGKKALIALAVIVPLAIAGGVFAFGSLGGKDEPASPTLRVEAADRAADSRDGGSDASAGAGSGSGSGSGSDAGSNPGSGSGRTSGGDARPRSGGDRSNTDSRVPLDGEYGGTLNQQKIAQDAGNKTYPATMSISGDGSFVTYPTLNCKARLIPTGFDGDSRIYREELVYGQGTCDEGGTWWVLVLGPDELEVRYSPASGRYRIDGNLFRE